MVHFFNKKLTWQKPFTIKKYRKPHKSNIRQTKIRNLLATTQGITGGRLDKVGWIESYNYHKHLVKYQKPLTLIVSDSIAKGYHRYIDVCYWRTEVCYFNLSNKQYQLDRTWRYRKGIEHKIELVKYKFYNLKLMV